jgi:hypothetical protein
MSSSSSPLSSRETNLYEKIVSHLNLLIERSESIKNEKIVKCLKVLNETLFTDNQTQLSKKQQLNKMIDCLEKSKEMIAIFNKEKWSAKVLKKRKKTTQKSSLEKNIEVALKDLEKAFAIIYMIILIESQFEEGKF